MITKRRLSVGFSLKDNDTKKQQQQDLIESSSSDDVDTDTNEQVNKKKQQQQQQHKKQSGTNKRKETEQSEDEDNHHISTDEDEEGLKKKQQQESKATEQQQMTRQLSAVARTKRKSILPTNINSNNMNSIVVDGLSRTNSTTLNNNNNNNNNTTTPANRVPKKLLTNDQISEIYSNCIKLSTENKINQKNTWQLNLIDHIDDVLSNQQQQHSDTLTNFQAASCTLDASVKIYSSRVDSVHSDLYKIWSGLTRSKKGDKNEDDEDEQSDKEENQTEGGEGQDTETGDKKAKKKKKSGTGYLEQNMDSITCKKFDITFMVDPLFSKMSANFDEAGVNGLIINKLPISNSCKILLDSTDSTEEKPNDPLSSQPIDISLTIDTTRFKKLFADLSNNNSSSTNLCPRFSRMIQETDLGTSSKSKKEEKHNTDVDDHTLSMLLDKNVGGIDLDIDDDNVGDHDYYDYGGGGGGYEDMGDGGGGNDEGDQYKDPYFSSAATDSSKLNLNEEDDGNGSKLSKPNGVAFGDIANNDWDDMSFFDNPNMSKNWAGPEYWRFNRSRRQPIQSKGINNENEGEIGGGGDDHQQDEPNTTTANGRKKKTTKKKGSVFIDFDAPPPPDSMFEAPKGRQSTVLTDAAIKKASETSTILPPDIHYDMKQLCRLFNKPKWIVPPASRRDEFFKSLYPQYNNNNNNDNDSDDERDHGDADDNNNNDDHNTGIESEYDFPSSQCFNQDTDNTINGDHGGDGGFGGDWEDNGGGGGGYESEATSFTYGGLGTIGGDGDTSFGLNGGGGNRSSQMGTYSSIHSNQQISYVRFAKKIDVKALKTSIWGELLTLHSKQKKKKDDKSDKKRKNRGDSDDDEEQQEQDSIVPSNSQENDDRRFSKLVSDLKDGKKSDASVPLTFICLLHLANEQNLHLHQVNKDLTNFEIQFPANAKMTRDINDPSSNLNNNH